MSFNINPEAGVLSKAATQKHIFSMPVLEEWLRNLRYGRNTDRSDFSLIFEEERGTCSTKHALFKAIALENRWDNVRLCMGFFMMSALNTPKLSTVFASQPIMAIPEAHSYLRIKGIYTDLTGIDSHIVESDLTDEAEIEPYDIGLLKESIHKGFISRWAEEQGLRISDSELWKIREECIAALGTP